MTFETEKIHHLSRTQFFISAKDIQAFFRDRKGRNESLKCCDLKKGRKGLAWVRTPRLPTNMAAGNGKCPLSMRKVIFPASFSAGVLSASVRRVQPAAGSPGSRRGEKLTREVSCVLNVDRAMGDTFTPNILCYVYFTHKIIQTSNSFNVSSLTGPILQGPLQVKLRQYI